MDNDVYRKPEAELIDESNAPSATQNSEHYVLPLSKLWIYSLLSFGVFLVPWNYIHWRHIKQTENSSIWPVPRAIFSIFFIYPLFNAIDASKERNGAQFSWSVGVFALLYILFSIIGNVLDQIYIGMKIEAGVYYFVIFFSALMVPVVCASKAQRVANLACGDVDGESNSDWTIGNVLWMVFCLIFVGLAIFGFASGEIE